MNRIPMAPCQTLRGAFDEAWAVANRDRILMAVVEETDEDSGRLVYGWCPQAALRTLYRVQLEAGIARVVAGCGPDSRGNLTGYMVIGGRP